MLNTLRGSIVVVAPHPDDEILGAGGTLLRARALGIETYWIIVTEMDAELGWPEEKIARRQTEIETLREAAGFSEVFRLRFPTARLETLPLGRIVGAIGDVVKAVKPACVLLPHRGDAHTDHHVVWEAGAAATKWFRYPSVDWVMSYETLSETDAGLNSAQSFQPQIFVDITETIDAKIAACEIFADELAPHPFPRSTESLRALATLRGAASGYRAAEAFMLHRARIGRA